MQRSRRTSRTSRRKRRQLVWARNFTTGTLIASQTVANAALATPARFNLLDTFETAYGANLIGCTIMAIKGYLGFLGQSTVAGDHFFGRVGIKVTDQPLALVAGNDSLYDTSSQTGGAHDDWMAFFPLFVSSTGAGQVSPGWDGAGSSWARVDVQSRRRLSELGQSLMLDVSGIAVTGIDLVYAHDLSVLVALP